MSALEHSSTQDSLVAKVAAVHVVYWVNREKIFWFGQLASCLPGILVPLTSSASCAVVDGSELVGLCVIIVRVRVSPSFKAKIKGAWSVQGYKGMILRINCVIHYSKNNFAVPKCTYMYLRKHKLCPVGDSV